LSHNRRTNGVARLAPKALSLSENEQNELQQLINRHNTPQQIALLGNFLVFQIL
jgi:putative transposase